MRNFEKIKVRVRGLSARYFTTTGNVGKSSGVAIDALSNISFELETGDRLAVIGVSGSGKSTLLKVLSGALPQCSGQVETSHEKLSLLNRYTGLVSHASLFENAMLKAYSLGMASEQARIFTQNCLEISHLVSKAQLPLSTMSAGMAGRFNLAINTQVVKEITILDEWVGELGMGQLEGDGLLGRLIAHEGVVVMASHNEALVRRFANKALLLDQGVAVYFGGQMDYAYKLLREIQQADRSENEESVTEPTSLAIKENIHLLFPRRCGFNAMRELFSQYIHPDFKLVWHHEHSNPCLSQIPKGERVILFYRDPIERAARIFEARFKKGAPFNDSPWTNAERQIFESMVTLGDLAELLDSGNKSQEIKAFKSISRVNNILASYSDTYKSTEYIVSRGTDIAATICADNLIVELQEVMSSIFNDDLSWLRIEPDLRKHIELSRSDQVSDAATSNLRTLFEEEYIYYEFLKQH